MDCGLICEVKGETKPIPLQKIDVDVSIIGYVADVDAKLIYKNDLDNPVEVTFIFPLDDESAIYRLIAEIDGRKIEAEVQEKQKARETYDEAIQSGHTAALLEESDATGDVFTCKLGNLPPKGEAILTFSFVSELSIDPDGSVKFEMPTVLNPRYSPAGKQVVIPDVPYVCNSKLPYDLNFNVAILGGRKITKVDGGKDKLTVSPGSDGTKVKLAEAFNFDHDITLNIFYEESHQPHAVFEAGHTDKSGLLTMDAAMLNFFPKVEGTVDPSKKEFIFLIDRSGSMMGEKIESAREALLLFLKSLPIGCYFNVIGFGSEYKSMFNNGSRVYNEENQKYAAKDQANIDANLGGTEILEPMNFICKNNPVPGRQREVFVITDGEVWNVEEIIGVIKKSTNTRVFSLGIGQGASSSLVKGIAKAGRGKSYFVKDNERVHGKVINLLKCAMQVPVSNVKLEWDIPSGITANQVPSTIPQLFDGDKLILYTVFDKPISKDLRVKLTGDVGKDTISHDLILTKGQSGYSTRQPIHRLTAKQQIKQLELKMEDDESSESTSKSSNKEEIVLISQAANVISAETSFVAVDKTSKVEGDMSKVDVPRKMTDQVIFTRRDCPSFQFDPRQAMRCSMPMACPPQMMMCSAPMPRSAPMSNVMCMDMLDMCEDSMDCLEDDCYGAPPECEESAPVQQFVGYMRIVSLQEFAGNWKLTKEVADALGSTLDNLKAKNKTSSEDIWATCLALAFLHKKYASDKEEWEMIEEKALNWLKTELKSGNSADLIADAAKVL